MNEFEDPQIERLLGSAGGSFPDVNTAYSQVTGRVRVIRRRRAVVATTAACLLLAGGAAFAFQGAGGSRSNLSPSDTASLPDDSVTDSSTPSSTDDSQTPGTVDDGGSTGSNNGTGGTTAGGGTTSGGGGTTPNTAGTTDGTTTTVAAAPQFFNYDGIGGAITVRLQNGALSLVSSSPSAGFHVDSSLSRADRVEVRFRSNSSSQYTNIRVDLVGGQPQLELDEKD